jgi:predicted NodU family carbamoyl transferase
MTTAFLGFEMLEDEYKVMGLAAYANVDEHRAFFDSLSPGMARRDSPCPTLLKKAGGLRPVSGQLRGASQEG